MTNVLNSDDGFEAALAALRAGKLVAVPTETVYGLAADATHEMAVAKIYAAKGRPSFNPLIIHVSGLEMAEQYGVLDPTSKLLADQFWPGPLTLVLPLAENSGVAPSVTAELGTIAMRQPSGVMAKLAEELGKPIAAPSANTSGRISPTLARHVERDLGEKVSVILDDGPCDVGLESTILKVEGESVILLREGGLSVERIEEECGVEIQRKAEKSIEAPGMMLAHYAPTIPMRLEATDLREGEALLAFGEPIGDAAIMRNLSESSDLDEAARNLFAMMSELDASGVGAIAVQSIPRHGLGAALNDRLERAAHGANQR